MSARRKRPSADHRVEPTVVDGPLAGQLHDESAAPAGDKTVLDPPPPRAAAPASPIQVFSKMDRSDSFQAISMKTPGAVASLAPAPTPLLPRPNLRAGSEQPASPQNLGRVAPPYDPEDARARRLREYAVWGCIAVMLASAIALIVWFAAR